MDLGLFLPRQPVLVDQFDCDRGQFFQLRHHQYLDVVFDLEVLQLFILYVYLSQDFQVYFLIYVVACLLHVLKDSALRIATLYLVLQLPTARGQLAKNFDKLKGSKYFFIFLELCLFQHHNRTKIRLIEFEEPAR